MSQLVRVVTSTESAARDASAIAAGIPSRALMQRAGAAAAGEVALRYRDRLHHGVLVLAGPGNNGGDAWVVARALTATGVHVRVIEPVAAKTPDAIAERALALAVLDPNAVSAGPFDRVAGPEALIVDGLLGTGASGEPRDDVARAIDAVAAARVAGASVIALDLPSGVDASTGTTAGVSVTADLTLTFGTVKRGHLVNRDACGTIVVLDIGLGTHAAVDDRAPLLVDEAWVASQTPAIPGSAHKGFRRKLAIVGGAAGMAGAAVLAGRAAMRSGIGMVKLVVSPESLAVVQETEPYALASAWPINDATVDGEIVGWADAIVVGPGLGRSDASRVLLERILRRWTGATLLDADALTLFEGRAVELSAMLGGRPTLITPHAAEFARLAGSSTADVLTRRFEIGQELAATLGAAVLLKGTPTVISAPDGRCLASASGTPALAAAGSGDVLSGIAGTLLAQLTDPLIAGAIGAWVHGRAAERVPTTGGGARGTTLDDVVNELRDSWVFDSRPGRYPVLAELPSVAARQ